MRSNRPDAVPAVEQFHIRHSDVVADHVDGVGIWCRRDGLRVVRVPDGESADCAVDGEGDEGGRIRISPICAWEQGTAVAESIASLANVVRGNNLIRADQTDTFGKVQAAIECKQPAGNVNDATGGGK